MGLDIETALDVSGMISFLQLRFFKQTLNPIDYLNMSDQKKRCYRLLKATSRSFYAVIMELKQELRDTVMIFYLILRSLDTIEDDMNLDFNKKIDLLTSFHDKLTMDHWSYDGISEHIGDRCVLVEFDSILSEFHLIRPDFRKIIKKITQEMGRGMAQFIQLEKDSSIKIQTIKEYDLYCFYVAGLVGEGLTRLMGELKAINPILLKDDFKKSLSMSLFLQKTNIIRDFHEDMILKRHFWPKNIWIKYTDDLTSFYTNDTIESKFKGLCCINELVLNAMSHIQQVLEFLILVNDPSCFSFCAIPQVMAVATLAEIYNNCNVLTSNVKIKKNVAYSLILNSRTMSGVLDIFRKYIFIIYKKSSVSDPNYLNIALKCAEIEKFCESVCPRKKLNIISAFYDKNNFTDFYKKRKEIDDKTKMIISNEYFNLRLCFFSFLVILSSLIYFFLKKVSIKTFL